MADVNVEPCTLYSVKQKAAHIGICFLRTEYPFILIDRWSAKIGTIVGSKSLNPNAEEFGLSGLNRTQAGGLVDMT
jgi:hypothetical protein